MNDIEEHLINFGIAIIGMSGRFPGANTIRTFWENIQGRKETIQFFSESELAAAGVPEKMRKDPNYVPAKGILEDITGFDASFFHINPREAELIDPQQRIFLECAWEAFEDGGYDPLSYSGRIGTFASVSKNTYLLFNLMSCPELYEAAVANQVLIANDKDYVSTRTSYKLNLRGPSITVQTACSSSLVAVHLACQSLLSGECEMAIAGGVSIDVPHKAGYLYQPGSIFSPDGHCRVFDANARGTVFGQGCGIVLLKPLKRAIEDRDSIHAVIRSSAINNDGSNKTGFTAPSIEGQADVIAEAIGLAQIDPQTISYIEAHGTGTSLGDPMEIEALKQAFAKYTQAEHFCALGSVKTNIGHLNVASGIAGLIKATLSLEQNEIPSSLHFDRPNPQIDFDRGPFFVSRGHAYPEGGPRRAGISSFGIGGTNAHVVLEQSPVQKQKENGGDWQLLLLSGRSLNALKIRKEQLADFISSHHPSLGDVAYTLQLGRHTFSHRSFVVCKCDEEAISALLNDQSHCEQPLCRGRIAEDSNRSIAFFFPSVPINEELVQELYHSEPAYRSAFDHCNPQGADSRHIASQYALAQLWISWGIEPKAVFGEGIGKQTATLFPMHKATENEGRLILEIGSGNKFRSEQPYLVSLPEQMDMRRALLTALGNLWLAGFQPAWTQFHVHSKAGRIPLPTYPFEHKRYWIERREQQPSPAVKGESSSSRSVEQEIAAIFSTLLGVKEVGLKDDFFDLGGHSLLGTQLLAAVKEKFGLALSLHALFDAPTVESIANLINGANVKSSRSQDWALDPRWKQQHSYTFNANPKAIFLTGATGFLGSYLLDGLLKKTDAAIYCLVREKTPRAGLERIEKICSRYGLLDPGKKHRICVLLGDLSEPKFGLSKREYDQLAQEVSSIYHCGARLSFIDPYRQLSKINVEGTRRVVELACQGLPKHIHHVSSIAAYDSDKHKGLPFADEELPLEGSWGFHSGYDETKWVSEMMVAEAAKRGIPVTIYRPGNICGDSRTGKCSATDLVGIMLRGCIGLQAAPENDDIVDVVPIDYVSSAMIQLSLQPNSVGQKYNLVNPHPTRWSDLVRLLQQAGYTIDTMPFDVWREKLRLNRENSLFPLLPTFDDRPLFSNRRYGCKKTIEGLKRSGIQCRQMDAPLFNSYIHHLKQIGVL
jgi:thioester reductase-like protein